MRVDEDGQWVGFRDVVELNGRQLEERGDRLATLFVDGGTNALAQARRISEESARYNLGATERTFNVPTYPLFFLHPANVDRFRFERLRTGRAGCAGAAAAWDVRFEEVAYPTMARGLPVASACPPRGRFCLDPQSGRVARDGVRAAPPRGQPRAAGDRDHRPRHVRARAEAESLGSGRDARQRLGGRRQTHGRHRAIPELPAVQRHRVGEHGPAARRARRPAVTAPGTAAGNP